MRKKIDNAKFKECVLSGMKYKDIAAAMNMAQDSVRAKVVRMRKAGQLPITDNRIRNGRTRKTGNKYNCNMRCELCTSRCQEFIVVSTLIKNGIKLVNQNKSELVRESQR